MSNDTHDNAYLESTRFTSFSRTCPRCLKTWTDIVRWRQDTVRAGEEIRELRQWDRYKREHVTEQWEVRLRRHAVRGERECGGLMYEPTAREPV